MGEGVEIDYGLRASRVCYLLGLLVGFVFGFALALSL